MAMTISYPSDVARLPLDMRATAYRELMRSPYRQDTLDMRINAGMPLTEEEVEAAVTVLGKGCRKETKGRLRWALKACPVMVSYGIYQRLHFLDGEVSYCAGQSYPDELRTMRQCLIGR